MALLQQTNAIYHHPLEAVTGETVVGAAWTKTNGRFDTGKIGLGMEGEPAGMSWGSKATFQAGVGNASGIGVHLNAVATLDATRVAIIYAESRGLSGSGDSNQYSKGVVATISGVSITFGSTNDAILVASGQYGTSFLSLSKLDTDKLVACFAYLDGSVGRANILTTSGVGAGATISLASAATFNVTPVSHVFVAALSTTAFIVVYDNNVVSVAAATVKVGTVSGTSISLGSAYGIGGGDQFAIAKLSSTKVLVVMRERPSFTTAAVALGISGSTITVGPESFTGGVPTDLTKESPVWAVGLTESTAVIFDTHNSGTSKLVTVTGLNLTVGPDSSGPLATGTISLARVDDTHFVWATGGDGSTSLGRGAIASVAGTTITWNNTVDFGIIPDGAGDVAIAAVGTPTEVPTHMMVAYAETNHPTGVAEPGEAKATCLFYASDLTATSGAYATTVGSEKLGYTAWLMDPSSPCS